LKCWLCTGVLSWLTVGECLPFLLPCVSTAICVSVGSATVVVLASSRQACSVRRLRGGLLVRALSSPRCSKSSTSPAHAPIVPFWSWRFSASSCGRPRAWSCGAWIASAVRSSDGLRHVERVRAAGGTFYSVHDGLDTSTEAGRLVMKILLSVAEFQMEGVRSGWDVARERAIRRGVHINPWTPWDTARRALGGCVRTRARRPSSPRSFGGAATARAC
jgi:hypothetical protein